MPVVTAAFCPHPPLLVPQLTGAQSGPAEDDPLGRVREACVAAVSVLVPGDGAVVVLGPGATNQDWTGAAGGSLRPWGVDVAVGGARGAGAGDGAALPLSLAVGAWLLDQAEVQLERRRYRSIATADTADGPIGDDVALLVMADGSARRTPKAPGAFHPGAEAYDAAIARALGSGDPRALRAAAQDPLGEQVLAGGAAVWVAAAALIGDRRPRTAELLASEAPYGVGYLVARWSWAD